MKDVKQGWTAVVAVAENGVIGRSGDLPWRISSDLRRFKTMTMGHCLLMGRKTFESIGRGLPGRQTIVLSRSSPDVPEGIKVAEDLEQVDALTEPGRRIMVVGGAEVYRASLPRCDSIWLTRVKAEIDGDTRFPEIDWSDWQITSREPVQQTPQDDWPTEFQQWSRLR